MPEAIVQFNGSDNNDCERHTAKRFVAKLRKDDPDLKFIVTEASLSSNVPHVETLHDHDLHYILGVNAGDHAFLWNQVQASERAERVTYEEWHDRAAGLVHRFRFVDQVPRNASNTDGQPVTCSSLLRSAGLFWYSSPNGRLVRTTGRECRCQ
jgi:hypothetical protein